MKALRSPFRSAALLAGLVFPPPSGFACGGGFVETVLEHPNAALLSPPTGFGEMLHRIDVPPTPFVSRLPSPAVSGGDRREEDTLDLEMADLTAVLGETHPALSDYRELRELMLRRYETRERPEREIPYGLRVTPESARAAELLAVARRGDFPAGLPADVIAYLAGAIRYTDGDVDGAAEIWRRLLTWRETDRPNRSVWAAWMLAKINRDRDRAESDRWYRETIRLARAGFRDPLGLERYAGGWLGRSALDRGDRREAIVIYANQTLSGDRLGFSSLQRSLPSVEKCSDADLDRYAIDPFLRNVLTAALLRAAGSGFFGVDDFSSPSDAPDSALAASRRWLAAIDRNGVRETGEAERFALMAYQLGDFETCERWLAHARADAQIANSLRGKLALQRGELDSAERFFRLALPAKAPPPAWGSEYHVSDSDAAAVRGQHALADHAVVQIARKNYPDALVNLLDGRYRVDSAYVAERLLSLRELIHTANALRAADSPAAPLLSAITARRLARENHLAVATEYFPKPWQPIYRFYTRLRLEGADLNQSAEIRADRLWQASQFHRVLGSQFFATFHHPDGWRRLWWRNQPTELARIRAAWDFSVPRPAHPPIQRDEIFRAARHQPRILRRYSFIFAASDLAWQAAALMPDRSEETARVLGVAGTWIKYLDPPGADRFYKAMIWRNWSTPLARQADQKRWFPDIAWEYDPFAAAELNEPSERFDDFYY